MRWQQFDALIAGSAPMPEPGFAWALDYQVAGNAEAGRKAVAWALGPAADLRQLALVYDWCQDLLSDAQRRDLAARIEKLMLASAADASVPAVRARAMAAVALFDDVPRTPPRELSAVVHTWWEKKDRARPSPRPRRHLARRRLPAIRAAARDARQHQPRPARILPRVLQGLSDRAPVELLPRAAPGPGHRVLHRGRTRLRRSGPPPGRAVARGRARHGGLRPECRLHPGAAGLADARPLHPARHLRRALRVPLGQPLSARD